ncbi:hypothetical protein [Bacillus sp. SG-1]|uniref:hypothetical protein n=1 Tax=Bacillus sp. SG-1 TaxID=161544 RepID=UPI00015453F1|nr:hypothetical protein [Bacillus sp. SG-1]EDL63517.1 hypothetical protein BSG1_13511 [Bacillus sp. SG-1]
MIIRIKATWSFKEETRKMFEIIKSFYEEKKADGTYTFTDNDLKRFMDKGYISAVEASDIKSFEQI